MKYVAQCIVLFLFLTILFVLLSVYWLDLAMHMNGIIFFSAFVSLIITIIYGWIDDVYIKKRQSGAKE